MTDCTPKPWGRWQPIESAPRDGRLVLARQGGYYPHSMAWKDGKWIDVIFEVEHVPTHWLPPTDDAHGETRDKEG